MADVRFEHVYKQYGDGAPVITDLNLAIHDHEFLVLVGPSGCGKSTALRMIAGLEEISDGQLLIGDRVVNEVAPKDRDIAMVFQNYALYPHMSVYQNMAFGLQLRHTPKAEIEQRVQQAATLLGIQEYLTRKPRALSGGQRQRVALGRALVRNPQVFLLDEPLSNLDAKLRVQTRAVIARLHQTTKTTFVYVTHDQVEAMTMGDRIAVLNAGIIQQLGTPQELYDHPANLFVAGFIGSPSMDFFNATLDVTSATGPVSAMIGEGAAARRITLPDEVAQAARALPAATSTPSTGEPRQGSQGRRLILGVRPEDLRLASGASEDNANTVVGTVDVVEHLGNEQLVYLSMPGAMIPDSTETKAVTARVAPDAVVRPGQRLSLSVDASRLHLFDATSGKRLE